MESSISRVGQSLSLSHHYIIITSYCSVPGSGSFVRRRKLDFGESFIEVFKKVLNIDKVSVFDIYYINLQRYNRETVEDVAIGKGTHGKVVEFVGMDNLFDKVR